MSHVEEMWEDVISIYNHLDGRFAFFSRPPQVRWILPVCGLCVCVCECLKIRIWLFVYPCSLQRTLYNALNATPSTLAEVHNGNVLPLSKIVSMVHLVVSWTFGPWSGWVYVCECWHCRRNLVVPSIQFIFFFVLILLTFFRTSEQRATSINWFGRGKQHSSAAEQFNLLVSLLSLLEKNIRDIEGGIRTKMWLTVRSAGCSIGVNRNRIFANSNVRCVCRDFVVIPGSSRPE